MPKKKSDESLSQLFSQILASKEEVEQLKDTSPALALNASRTAAEQLCVYFLQTKDLLSSGEAIPRGLEALRVKVKIHSPKFVDQHLQTLQIYGNRGSHFQIDHQDTSSSMVAICLLALAELVDWFISQYSNLYAISIS